MIELLVVIAIATIGVVYTSSTGEAESNVMADKSAKDALNEAEGQSGIGILGIDVVARKMRKVVGLREGAVSADSIAEYRAEEDDAVADDDLDDEDFEEDQYVDQGSEDASDTGEDFADRSDDWDDDWDEEAELAAAEDEDWENDPDLDPAPAPVGRARWHDAPAEHAETGVAAETAPGTDDEIVFRNAAESRVAMARPTAPATIDTENAPIVDEFDPEQDQILIGYRPGEAGNGRIGIIEDPLRPGSAAVTLGGRCVAVVLDGFGKVRAHHIDLVCEDDDLAA